jgi:hypothetical protein
MVESGQLLYPQGRSPWYPLAMRLGGPQSQSGRCVVEKNSLSLQGIKPVDHCYIDGAILAVIRYVTCANMARTMSTLTEGFCGFLGPLQGNAGLDLKLGHGHFLPNFSNSLFMNSLSFDSMLPELLMELLNKS